MGSVKDLRIFEEATATSLGRARFFFSDRYSVFDWGEMPDHISHKGEAIALLGAYFFEKLEEIGISTHYLGLVENNSVRRLPQLRGPSATMEIKLVRVLRPEFKSGLYDYSIYKKEKSCFLIPLEIMYRNSLPPGSSVFRRLKSGELNYKDLGLDKEPQPDQKLSPPFLDASTKLETTDRYLSWSEAQEISGLSDEELEGIKKIILTVNDLISEEFSKIGLFNEDGKVELAFDCQRRLMLVDVLGTLDECRFTYDSIPVSKEAARIHYRRTDWFQAVEEAKKEDREHWKEICRLKPDPLPAKLRLLITQMYCACTNEVTEREWFEGIPLLKEILRDLKELLGS